MTEFSFVDHGCLARITRFEAKCLCCDTFEIPPARTFLRAEKELREFGWKHTKRGWICPACVKKGKTQV